MAKLKQNSPRKWYTMDLHLHTPASSDYQEQQATYLDILQRAEARGLDIIAFSDHNTVAGYRIMEEEIKQLELLKKLDRIMPEEDIRLKEFLRLREKILVLPGFEFTATFGFHILAVFPPDKPVREIEHLLLQLNVPVDQIDEGSATIGASADVLMAYQLINEAGGMAIAAHANSSNGVAMRGFSFGGQTKIAYTQDPNLMALEVTDLESRSKRTTARFFSGTKPEYPRRMHCIQGSDAHRLSTDSQRTKNLGIGDRVTEVLIPEVSFQALHELFTSNDFARTRPRRKKKGEPDFDYIRIAREEGSNIVQDFHESMSSRGGKLYAVIA
ncbi:MAG: transcriptional regulator, partial [Chloroflexota bacterium]